MTNVSELVEIHTFALGFLYTEKKRVVVLLQPDNSYVTGHEKIAHKANNEKVRKNIII